MVELFGWELNSTIVGGTFLWSLALYISLDEFRDSLIDGLESLLRKISLGNSQPQNSSELSESSREIFASLISILPFLMGGVLCHWLVEIGFGQGWSVSMGVLVVISCAVYDLGRKDSRRQD